MLRLQANTVLFYVRDLSILGVVPWVSPHRQPGSPGDGACEVMEQGPQEAKSFGSGSTWGSPQPLPFPPGHMGQCFSTLLTLCVTKWLTSKPQREGRNNSRPWDSRPALPPPLCFQSAGRESPSRVPQREGVWVLARQWRWHSGHPRPTLTSHEWLTLLSSCELWLLTPGLATPSMKGLLPLHPSRPAFIF